MTRRTLLKRGFYGLLAAGLLDSWGFERFFIATRTFQLHHTAVPALRLVQISDLHLQHLHWGLRRLARQINHLRADALLFTGDAIDEATKLPVLRQFLELLDPQIPKLAILGNWEYWGRVNLAQLSDTYAACNGQLLVNQHVRLTLRGFTLAITGVDDFIGGRADYRQAITGFQAADFHVVLTHCPQHRDVICADYHGLPHIDLILSGHTHGGQINLLGWSPFLPPGSGRYRRGWYREEQQPPLYVSAGIGTSILPLRFGARSEIAVFDL